MAQRSKSTPPEPVCIIPMQSDYLVSREMFDDYAEPKVRNSRRWSYPLLDLVSYKHGVLTVKARNKDESYMLTFRMEPEQLKIRCSCRGCGPKLCEHSYHALQRMAGSYHQDYFERLLPGGPVDFAFRHPNWLRTNWDMDKIYVNSRNPAVSIYGFDKPELSEELTGTIAIAEAFGVSTTVGVGLTYIITNPFKNRWMPAVIPCLGNLTKAGDKVKGFQNYLTGIGKDSDHLLTERERVLNLLVLELYHEVEKLPGRISKVAEEDKEKLAHAFELWRQAFAFLMAEPHVFTTQFYGPRFLRRRPEKQYTHYVSLRSETIKPAFKWVKKPHHYELSLHFEAGGRKLLNWDSLTPFYLFAGEELFAWDSLRDAAVAEWFPWESKVVVSKDKLGEFNGTVLSVLKRQYTVIEASWK